MNSSLYLNRAIEEVITEASRYFSVLSVTGPRQSGKSTLLKHLFPEMPRYSLKDVNVREFAEHDPVAFLRQHPRGMFIDEIQRVPQLLEYIQGIVDDNPDTRYLLTGSSNFELLHHISESLPGRAGVFELLPMTYKECETTMSSMSLDEFLYSGLYPAVCARKNKARLFYPSYVKTYLERDVRDLLRIKDQMQFIRFMKLCAARVGSIFNASELAGQIGVDSKTVTHWLSVLQASYLVTLLPPYHENISKRLVKSPKLYFHDTGLACSLLDIRTAQQVDTHFQRGSLFENMVINQFMKRSLNEGRVPDLRFWRDNQGNEVDLLEYDGDTVNAYEIKSGATFSPDYFKGLAKWAKLANATSEQLNVIYTGTTNLVTSNGNLRSWLS